MYICPPVYPYQIAARSIGAGLVSAMLLYPLGFAWLGIGFGVGVAALSSRKILRRLAIARQPFPEAWSLWLEAHIPAYAAATKRARTQFERDVQFVLHEVRFEAVNGARVTEWHRLAVAAGVAVLLHGRPAWEYPSRVPILFYPAGFDEDYFEGDRSARFDGMAHEQGPLIFALPAVEDAWRTTNGSNVILHELAHVFDRARGGIDGVPALIDRGSIPAWELLMQRELRKVRMGKSILRRYAGTNLAELFAVSTEVFFERPHALSKRHPELFEALKAAWAIEPRVWFPLDERST